MVSTKNELRGEFQQRNENANQRKKKENGILEMENRWKWKFPQMNSALDMTEGIISVLKETPVETIQSEAWI